jgi:hypothetical protein
MESLQALVKSRIPNVRFVTTEIVKTQMQLCFATVAILLFIRSVMVFLLYQRGNGCAENAS